MDLESLRSFIMVVECDCLRTAAGKLDMSLAALAALIDDLEIQVGASLLERAGQGGTPTDAGRQVYQDALQLLASVDSLRSRTLLPPDSLSGKATLAAPVALARLLVAPLLVRVREQLPGVQLDVASEYTEIAQQGLLGGRVDFAVLAEPPASDRLAWRPMVVEPYVLAGNDPMRQAEAMLIAPPVNPGPGNIARLPAIRMDDAIRLPLIAQTPRMQQRRDMDARFAALGLTPSVVIESDSQPTLEQVVRNAGAYVIAPSSFANADGLPPGGIRARLVEPEWMRTLGLAWLAGRRFTQAQRAVAGLICDEITGLVARGEWAADILDLTGFELE
jgi:LysR family transcriptional regulator, nitrogen assimilation regulatory protein